MLGEAYEYVVATLSNYTTAGVESYCDFVVRMKHYDPLRFPEAYAEADDRGCVEGSYTDDGYEIDCSY